MEILGIGWQELIFIFIIALIVLGPTDMQKAGRTIAKWIRSILTSDAWMATQQISREAKKQWTHLIREASEDLNKISKETNIAGDLKDVHVTDQYKTPPRSVSTGIKHPAPSPANPSGLPPSNEAENTAQGEPLAVNPDAPAAVHRKASPRDGDESSAEDGSGNMDAEKHD